MRHPRFVLPAATACSKRRHGKAVLSAAPAGEHRWQGEARRTRQVDPPERLVPPAEYPGADPPVYLFHHERVIRDV